MNDGHQLAVGVVDLPQGILGLLNGVLDQLDQFRIAIADSVVEDLHQIAKTIGVVADFAPIDEAGDLRGLANDGLERRNVTPRAGLRGKQ